MIEFGKTLAGLPNKAGMATALDESAVEGSGLDDVPVQTMCLGKPVQNLGVIGTAVPELPQ